MNKSETLWYRPFSHFSGFVGHHQNDLLESLSFDSSSVYQNSEGHQPIAAFNFSMKSPAATNNDGQKYIEFSPKNKYFFITHFEMQQRIDGYDINFIQKWRFEGSNDKNEWTLLDSGESDKNFLTKGQIKLLSTKKGIYKYFRLKEIAGTILVVQKIDIYGFLCDSAEECSVSFLFLKSSKCLNILSLQPLFLHILI